MASRNAVDAGSSEGQQSQSLMIAWSAQAACQRLQTPRMVRQHMNNRAYRTRASVSGMPIVHIARRMRLLRLELSACSESERLRLRCVGGVTTGAGGCILV